MKNASFRPSNRPKSGETPIEPVSIAVRALVFLAADDERVARFLALTGLEAGALRGLIDDTGFQLAVLDHLAGDERLLLDFAQAEGLSPNSVGLARRALGGGDN